MQHLFRDVWSLHTPAHQQPSAGQGKVGKHLFAPDTEGWGWGAAHNWGSEALLTTCPPSPQHPPAGHQVPHFGTHSETESWRGLAACIPGGC